LPPGRGLYFSIEDKDKGEVQTSPLSCYLPIDQKTTLSLKSLETSNFRAHPLQGKSQPLRDILKILALYSSYDRSSQVRVTVLKVKGIHLLPAISAAAVTEPSTKV
jgi:hypothetical protein